MPDDFLAFSEEDVGGGQQAPAATPESVVRPQAELPVVPPPLTVAPAQPPVQPQAVGNAQPVQPQAVPVQAPAQQVVQPQAADAAVQGQQPSQQQQAAQANAPQPQDALTALRESVEANRQNFETALAQSVYKLNEQEAEQLQDDPATFVPKFMARAHVDIVRNVLGTLSAHMPNVVMGLMEAQRVNAAREETLWNDFPQLDKVKHRDTVVQVAQFVNQMFPQLKEADRIKQVGTYAMMQLGLVGQPAKVTGTGTPAKSAHPALQTPQSIPAFTPAANGQVPTQTMTSAPQLSPFEAMDQMMQDYESGALDLSQ